MTVINFWILFAYVNILAFMFLHQLYSFEVKHDDNKEDYFEDESNLINQMDNKTQIKPDEYGIIGTLKDSQGNKYYAVLIDKKEMDQAIKEKEKERTKKE